MLGPAHDVDSRKLPSNATGAYSVFPSFSSRVATLNLSTSQNSDVSEVEKKERQLFTFELADTELHDIQVCGRACLQGAIKKWENGQLYK
jgi:hypothetical protein